MTTQNTIRGDEATCGKVLVVDDDPMISGMLSITLKGAGHRVEEAHSGEDALMIFSDVQGDDSFDVIIMDIEMGDAIDGYETCRRFRQISGTKDIPVIFLSAHEELEDRLKAYDAGGDDFMAKPFEISEVLRKTSIAIQHRRRRAEIAREGENSAQVALMMINALGESGVAMGFARDALSCTSQKGLAKLVIKTMASLELNAQVQIRNHRQTLTLTSNGAASPLEESVFEKMCTMGRIFSFKNRMIVNQDDISVLVLNMPLDDPDRCGRIRDHVALIVESSVRITGVIDLRTEMIEKNREIQALADLNRTTLEQLRVGFQQLQHGTFIQLEQVSSHVEGMFVHLGLSSEQENTISYAVRNGTENVRALFEQALKFDQEFTRIIEGLSRAADFHLPPEDEEEESDSDTSLNIDLW